MRPFTQLKPILLTSFFFLTFSAFVQAQFADCISAKEICRKELLTISSPSGEGSDRVEADMMHCFLNGDNAGQAEENSTWIKFEVKKSGSLAFTITPMVNTDDIDFVVFKLPANGDCKKKQVVRCMAAGYFSPDSRCMGKTGLKDGETDTSEDAGCNEPDDNAWLAPLKVVAGEKYAILISNVTAPRHGFTVSFSGTAKLPCEEDPIAKKEEKKKQPEKKKETPPPPPPVKTKPEQIGGRQVEVGETVKVKARTIKIKIWDSQVEDGDIVSVYIDDKKVINRHYLRLKPTEFEFELPPGQEHYITVYADDFGKAEPNTATLLISDGVNEQKIDLVAGRNKQESVKIILE